MTAATAGSATNYQLSGRPAAGGRAQAIGFSGAAYDPVLRRTVLTVAQTFDQTTFSSLELREQKEKLKVAIDQLPLQLKQVVTLAYFEGRSHKEIATVLQITPASSRIYLVRAIAMLRKHSEQGGGRVLLKLLWLAMAP